VVNEGCNCDKFVLLTTPCPKISDTVSFTHTQFSLLINFNEILYTALL